MKVTIGADPEVFVKNANGKFVSAHGMIPGTKHEPFKVRNGAVQVDGNALEFNIDPAATKTQFITNIKEVYKQMGEMVPGYNLAITPTAVFDKDYFDQLPPAAKELGCDPDFDAWERKVNTRPHTDEPFRTAAGHLHFGWRGLKSEGFVDTVADIDDPNHFDDCCLVAKEMDYYLGIQSLHWDKDGTRRMLYGKAGAFRPKPYGVEYRTLSNAWLQSEELMGWVYEAAQRGMRNISQGIYMNALYGSQARSIINENMTEWRHHYRFGSMELPPLPKLGVTDGSTIS